MGWNLGLSFKNLDFNMFTYASVGNDVYRAYERNAIYSNKARSVLGRWTGEGTTNDANNPRFTFVDANSNIRVSDRYVEDGSFVKIKNIQIGYTLPKSVFRNTVISKIRHHHLPVGASLLIRMHEISDVSIKDLRALMGDRRAKFRISDKQFKPKDADNKG
jgi:hypothetical protein